jgi:hypothetical protein
MDFERVVLFGKKTLSDLIKEIYTNSVDRKKSIKELVNELPMIESHNVHLIGPVLIGLVTSEIKNDENLIKLTGVIQRLLVAGEKGEDLPDAELKQLLAEGNSLVDAIKNEQ